MEELITESHRFIVPDFHLLRRKRREVIGEGRLRIDMNEYHVRESLRRWVYRRLNRLGKGQRIELHDRGLDISRDESIAATILDQWFTYRVIPNP